MASRTRGVNAAHTAGIFADMTLDGPEIGTLVAVVDRAKNLPNRRTMGKQDPYCAMRLGKEAKKTDTDKRGGQTPRWDQELRFTVHDTPDYFKLKCSVFNDDKKTDLIGEAWLDLQEVIVPGGGKSDQWRQLNFKGKYAGDIRIELTYYDTRPKPETPVESKRQRDKAYSLVNDTTGTASGPRQLGPREIKRRPLPPGPGGHSSPVPAAPTSEPWPSEDQNETFLDREYSNSNPPPRPPKQKFIPETPDDVGYDLNPRFGPDSYEPQYDSNPSYHQRQLSDDFHHTYEPSIAPYPDPDVFAEDPGQRRLPSAQLLHPQPVPGPEQQSFSTPQSPYDLPDHQSYHSSPPLRLTPQATPPASAPTQHWNGRTSTSPTKYTAYRDSPLRQSISHTDMPQSIPSYSDARFDEDDAPPPPPAHRGQISRVPVASPDFEDLRGQPSSEGSAHVPYQGSHGQPSPRTPVKFQSVEEKSPLQRVEHDYDPFQATPPSVRELQRQLPAPEPFDQSPLADHDRYPLFLTERRKSNNYEMPQFQPTSFADQTAPHEQFQNHNFMVQRYQGSPRDEFRRSIGYAPPQRAQTFDSFELHDERHVRRSDPIVVRPRAISPNPNHSIPRKSITPTPVTPDDQKHMASNPFSPDSYEVLNPGTIPAVDGGAYKPPENVAEVSRHEEVDRLRDQGPIIGNDGRVIDPSDHLPADTWAPEPERKQRKPEHVIKIRTREEARMHRGTGSSPASARPHSIAVSPYQSSTHAPTSSPYQSSPAPAAAPVSPQVESPVGRNRLRKPMPQRPLPTEPHQHPQSSPAVPTLPSIEPRPDLSSQRYTIHSSPAGILPQRPAFSMNQPPAANRYSLHGSTGPPLALEYRTDHMQQTPPRPPFDRQQPPESTNYGGGSPYGAENPLALELSRIDIGPSRIGGRTTLRPQKAYGAY